MQFGATKGDTILRRFAQASVVCMREMIEGYRFSTKRMFVETPFKFPARQLAKILCLCCIIFAATGFCADLVLEPGEYITVGGGGVLNITQGDDGKLPFSIHATGANGHTCDLTGEIKNGRAVMQPYQEFEACTVIFAPTANGVKVIRQQGDACYVFCGARAWFDGEYMRPAPGCHSGSAAQARNEFKDLYDKKSFASARTILADIVNNCEKSIGWLDLGWIRNDLAITLYHLKRPGDCLKTLEPLTADADLTEEEIRQRFSPTDADNYIPVIQATRTNLKLCRQLSGKR